MFAGYIIDDHHTISELVDRGGLKKMYLLTFKNQIIDGVVDCSECDSFSFEEIDPNDFQWNGRRVRIEITK